LLNHEITHDTVMKRRLLHRFPLLEGQRENGPAMPPFSDIPVHFILLALCLLVVVGYSVAL